MSYKVFLFQAEEATSKAGKPYVRQRVQIVQAPKAPDCFSLHFPKTLAEALAPGSYSCEITFRDSPTGPRLVFSNFAPVK